MGKLDLSAALSSTPDGVSVRVKVVPGASRSRIAGMLGERLKVMVAAPPEGGKANQAVCDLLAAVLGLRGRDAIVEAGHTQPRKRVLLLGASLCDVTERLGKAMR